MSLCLTASQQQPDILKVRLKIGTQENLALVSTSGVQNRKHHVADYNWQKFKSNNYLILIYKEN